jgi:hypothetical protein
MTETPEFRDAVRPENKGCDVCGLIYDENNSLLTLLSNQHGGRWLCREHFFKLRPDWTRPNVAKTERTEIPVAAVLSSDDLFRRGLTVGLKRYRDSKKRKDRAGAKKSLRDDLMGAIAEAYLAKEINEAWHESVGEFRGQKPDVGDNVEVRHTHHLNGGLILRPGENLGREYHLVLGPYPPEWVDLKDTLTKAHIPSEPIKLSFPGWMLGKEMAQDKWMKKPDPNRPACWLVPWRELHRLDQRLKSRKTK